MRFNIREFGDDSVENILENFAQSDEPIIIEVPLESIGFTNSYIDIAYDYLDAAFIGESLNDICKDIYHIIEYSKERSTYYKVCFFPEVNDMSEFAKGIKYLSELLSNKHENYSDVIGDFEDSLSSNSKIFKFPELIDGYFSNYIGSYYDFDYDTLTKIFHEYPERKYGFWRSPISNNIGFDCYTSQSCWIIEKVRDEFQVLKYLGFDSMPFVDDAEKFSVKNCDTLLSKNNIVKMPNNHIIFNAQKCASAILERVQIDNYCLFDVYDFYDTEMKQYKITSNAEMLIITDEHFKYLFFDLIKLNEKQISDIRKYNIEFIEKLDPFLNLNSQIACPWDTLDDNEFEELCYDVISSVGKFSSGSIRKMGKSRSRDGGRDLEAWTISTPRGKVKKFIYQCKLISETSSLSGSKINMADTIAQFSADGYGIMTSGLIDSTLYDKLDAISRNRGIEIDTWSRLELERYLDRNPNIKRRYFPK